MDSQTKMLLEKYWRAETSPEEEKMLKKLMNEEDENSAQGNYFKSIAESRVEESDFAFQHPRRRLRQLWYTVAASLIVGILVVAGLMNRQPAQSIYNVNDPEMAYQLTREALMMVSSGLNEGKNYSVVQLKQINAPKKMITNYNTNNQ